MLRYANEFFFKYLSWLDVDVSSSLSLSRIFRDNGGLPLFNPEIGKQ